MFHLQTSGTPRELGKAHGRRLKAKICQLLDHYRHGFRDGTGGWRKGLDPESRRAFSLKRSEMIAHIYPEACEEIDGIATGSGLPYEDIWELNLIYELTDHHPACSVYGFQDYNGHSLLGKSDDLEAVELGSNVLTCSEPKGVLKSLNMHFAGTIWTTCAVNEAGLAYGMTGLRAQHQNPKGIPALFLLHLLVSRCETAVEVERLCSEYQISTNGVSLLIGDATGDLMVLEKHTTGQATRRPGPRGAARWQTNHCFDANRWEDEDRNSPIHQNSLDREANIVNLDGLVPHTLKGLMDLYRTHDAPGGLCQHGAGGLHTDTAIIMDPTEREMWVTEGYPCETEFVKRSISVR